MRCHKIVQKCVLLWISTKDSAANSSVWYLVSSCQIWWNYVCYHQFWLTPMEWQGWETSLKLYLIYLGLYSSYRDLKMKIQEYFHTQNLFTSFVNATQWYTLTLFHWPWYTKQFAYWNHAEETALLLCPGVLQFPWSWDLLISGWWSLPLLVPCLRELQADEEEKHCVWGSSGLLIHTSESSYIIFKGSCFV